MMMITAERPIATHGGGGIIAGLKLSEQKRERIPAIRTNPASFIVFRESSHNPKYLALHKADRYVGC